MTKFLVTEKLAWEIGWAKFILKCFSNIVNCLSEILKKVKRNRSISSSEVLGKVSTTTVLRNGQPKVVTLS